MNTDVRPLVLTVRAVGVEFVRRILKPLIIIAIFVAVALLSFGGWLTTYNSWWWIIEVVFILAALALAVLLIVIRIVLRVADPSQDKSQHRAVSDFVDKLERTSEHLQTPQPVLVYRVVRDIIRRRNGEDSFIAHVARDSKTLAPDFLALQRLFGGGASADRHYVESKEKDS